MAISIIKFCWREKSFFLCDHRWKMWKSNLFTEWNFQWSAIVDAEKSTWLKLNWGKFLQTINFCWFDAFGLIFHEGDWNFRELFESDSSLRGFQILNMFVENFTIEKTFSSFISQLVKLRRHFSYPQNRSLSCAIFWAKLLSIENFNLISVRSKSWERRKIFWQWLSELLRVQF